MIEALEIGLARVAEAETILKLQVPLLPAGSGDLRHWDLPPLRETLAEFSGELRP